MLSCSNNTKTPCLNGAECISDVCSCPHAYLVGDRCEKFFNAIDLPFSTAIAQDTAEARDVYITLVTVLVVTGLLNNLAGLMTFTRERIRITACGIYLIVFTTTTTIRTIFLETVVFTIAGYDSPPWRVWSCYVNPYISLVFGYTCIWLSVGIAVERVLIECFNMNLYGTRRHAVIVSIGSFVYSATSNLPAIFARAFLTDPLGQPICMYDYVSQPVWAQVDKVLSYIHLIVPCAAHLICTVCILTTIARRKILIFKDSQMEQRLHRVWLRQLYLHRDFLVPPLFLIVCHLPNVIHGHLVVQCVPYSNVGHLRAHIASLFLLHVPFVFVFIVYIYPNESYMKEFRQTYFYRILCCHTWRTRRQQQQQRKYQLTIKSTLSESLGKPSF